MSFLDNETRTIIIQKTWCHGQLLAPFYALLCWIWLIRKSIATSTDHSDTSISLSTILILVYSGIILPLWCYISYRTVFVVNKFSSFILLIGGILVEIAYISVLLLSIQEIHTISSRINSTTTTSTYLSKSYFMLMAIASGLFAIETFAFIIIATTLHTNNNKLHHQHQSTNENDIFANDNTNDNYYIGNNRLQYYDTTIISSVVSSSSLSNHQQTHTNYSLSNSIIPLRDNLQIHHINSVPYNNNNINNNDSNGYINDGFNNNNLV